MPPFRGGIFNWYRGCMLAYKAPIPIEIARLCGRTLCLFNSHSAKRQGETARSLRSGVSQASQQLKRNSDKCHPGVAFVVYMVGTILKLGTTYR